MADLMFGRGGVNTGMVTRGIGGTTTPAGQYLAAPVMRTDTRSGTAAPSAATELAAKPVDQLYNNTGTFSVGVPDRGAALPAPGSSPGSSFTTSNPAAMYESAMQHTTVEQGGDLYSSFSPAVRDIEVGGQKLFPQFSTPSPQMYVPTDPAFGKALQGDRAIDAAKNMQSNVPLVRMYSPDDPMFGKALEKSRSVTAMKNMLDAEAKANAPQASATPAGFTPPTGPRINVNKAPGLQNNFGGAQGPRFSPPPSGGIAGGVNPGSYSGPNAVGAARAQYGLPLPAMQPRPTGTATAPR